MSYHQADQNFNWSSDVVDLSTIDDSRSEPEIDKQAGNESIHIENSNSTEENTWDSVIAELYAIDLIDDQGFASRDGTPAGITCQNDEIRDLSIEEDAHIDSNEPFNNRDNLEDYDLNEDEDEDAANDDLQAQNPWDMTNEEVEVLRAEQERVFGDIPDEDTEPASYTCVCGDSSLDSRDFIHLTCPDGCVRCFECLDSNVEVGLESKRNYPPMCCIPIEFENVESYLRPGLVERWVQVGPEYCDKTPVYCAVNTCSAYLPVTTYTTGGEWANCTECNIKTCTRCLHLESEHEDPEACPEALGKDNMDLVSREGWQTCPECRELIERIEGCNHMTCQCGEEFCYACGTSLHASIPCNCDGQNQWAQEMAEEADPERQQELWDNIMDGNGNNAQEANLAVAAEEAAEETADGDETGVPNDLW